MEQSTGLPISARGTKLIVHPNNMFNAERILKSTLQSGTANNDVNAIRNMGLLPEGYASNRYLTDTDAFFVRTNVQNGLIHFEREAMDFAEDNDFDTKNIKYAAYERYVFGWGDWRTVYGSAGA